MNKFDRVISTLVLLQGRKITSAAMLADRFGVSQRTIYRDINTLKTAGVPIIGDPGIGYSIMDGYSMPPIMITEQEAAALLTAGKFIGKMTDTSTQAYYANAMLKIKAILRSSEKHSLSVLDNSVAFTGSSQWEHKPYLQELFKAISAKQILDIDYQKSDSDSTNRKIEPIGCYHEYSNWYVVAYCQLKQDYRTFKMNRITKLQLLEDTFVDEHMSLQDYIDKQKATWESKKQFHSIEIAFSQSLVSFAESRKYYFGFVEQCTNSENEVVMKFLNPSLEIFARWLIQFGAEARVISPAALHDRIAELATELHRHYQ